MEDLIPLLIFGLLSAVGSWIQGRREKAEEVSWDDVEGEEPEARRPDGVPDVKSLEDEIRKALGFPTEASKSGTPEGQPPSIPLDRAPQQKTSPAPPPIERAPGSVPESRRPGALRPKPEAPRQPLNAQEALRAAREKRESAQRAREKAMEEGRRVAPGSKTVIAAGNATGTFGSVNRLGATLRDRRSARIALAASIALAKPRAFDPYQAPGDR